MPISSEPAILLSIHKFVALKQFMLLFFFLFPFVPNEFGHGKHTPNAVGANYNEAITLDIPLVQVDQVGSRTDIIYGCLHRAGNRIFRV